MKKNIKDTIIITLLALGIILPALASNVEIESAKQTYDAANNSTKFTGNVKVKMDDITIKSPTADIKMNSEGKLDVATFKPNAYAIKDNGVNQHELKANTMSLSLLAKKMKAIGNTTSKNKKKRKPMVTVHADSQEFDIKTNLMKAIGNVKIDYKDVKASSNEAHVTVDSKGNVKKVKLIGNGVIIQEPNEIKADNFLYNPVSNDIVATGNTYTKAKMEDGEVVDIYANYQQMDRLSNTFMASGKVKIIYQDYVAVGPKATFFPDKKTKKPNEIVFYGRTKIKEGDKEVEADKIVITMNPKNFTAEGNVKTSFANVKGLDSSLED